MVRFSDIIKRDEPPKKEEPVKTEEPKKPEKKAEGFRLSDLDEFKSVLDKNRPAPQPKTTEPPKAAEPPEPVEPEEAPKEKPLTTDNTRSQSPPKIPDS